MTKPKPRNHHAVAARTRSGAGKHDPRPKRKRTRGAAKRAAIAASLGVLLALGCGTEVVMEQPCDAGAPVDDAAVTAASGTVTARGACSWYGSLHVSQALQEAGCPLAVCPVDWDRTGRTQVVCDAAQVEACAWAIAGTNDCDAYAATVADCEIDCWVR